jgi:hypothetical protein
VLCPAEEQAVKTALRSSPAKGATPTRERLAVIVCMSGHNSDQSSSTISHTRLW